MYDELSLYRLHVFVTVVDRGGYSAAAEHLATSQPSVSFHIRALERVLGAPLLLYRDRRVYLTEAGEELYRSARAILSEGDNLLLNVQRIREGRSGRLRLGASIALEQAFFFQQVIGPFSEQHPDIALTLRFGLSSGHALAVIERELDLAYVNARRLPAGVHYEPLHRSAFVLLAGADHPLVRKDDVTAADIDAAGLIVAPGSDHEARAYRDMLREAGLERARVALEVDGVQARVLAAQAGLGVFGVWFAPYAGENAFHPLRRLRYHGSLPSAEFGLVSRKDEPWTPAMEQFRSWLLTVRDAAAAPPKPARAR